MQEENELKLMLSDKEYDMLMQSLLPIMTKRLQQTNYYYDTKNELMRKDNVTVRIRQKGAKLNGTIKRHLDTSGYSTEEHFSVDRLPVAIVLDGVSVWLRGALVTNRAVFRICEGIMLMLDFNSYLDIMDYELEVEFTDDLRSQAEGILTFIRSLLHHEHITESITKSERFFRRLNQANPS